MLNLLNSIYELKRQTIVLNNLTNKNCKSLFIVYCLKIGIMLISSSPWVSSLNKATCIFGSSRDNVVTLRFPTSSKPSHVSPLMSHILLLPWLYSPFFLAKSSALSESNLFLFNEWINEYVLKFLPQQDDEQGCTRSFSDNFWRRGAEEPCITHQDLGSNI